MRGTSNRRTDSMNRNILRGFLLGFACVVFSTTYCIILASQESKDSLPTFIAGVIGQILSSSIIYFFG